MLARTAMKYSVQQPKFKRCMGSFNKTHMCKANGILKVASHAPTHLDSLVTQVCLSYTIIFANNKSCKGL